MLRDLSYKDSEIDKEINNLIGKEFNFLEKIKRGGTGSHQLIIKKSDNYIYEILSKSYELNKCNIEIREKGIIIYFRSRQSTYGLAIPYYKLVTFKVDNIVSLTNEFSNYSTVIEIEARDKPGLLYEITNTLRATNINIKSAHIATFGERANDVFYVTNLFGEKIDSEEK